MNERTQVEFDKAVDAIVAGQATEHHLWLLLAKETDRDGFALRPFLWEGSGEYQRVEYNDGRDGLVRVPDGVGSVGAAVQRKVRLKK